MNVLLHNPVADLSSQYFLVFYGTVCILMLVLARWLVTSSDSSLSQGPERLPHDLDAYEIAYLRGGVNELVRFIVFDLTRSGALELVVAERKGRPSKIRRTEAPPPSTLTPEARIVFDYFAEPHTARELFASDVPNLVDAAYAGSREGLVRRELFASDATRAASRFARLTGFIVIGGVGAYRLFYAAMMQHRNIGFLIAIGVVALALLFVVTLVPRLSQRGRSYVTTLRAALPTTRDPVVASSAAFPLVIAAGGMAALAGTPYAGLSKTFRRQASSRASGSGCGGCSSSSCSSGGGGSCGGGGGCGG